MTNEEYRKNYIVLRDVKGLEGLKLLFARSRTLSSMRTLAEDSDPEKVIPLAEDFKAYEEELRLLYTKHCTIDGVLKTKTDVVNGKPIESFDINLSDPILKKDKAKLDAKFQEAIDFRKKQEKEYKEFLATEVKDMPKLFLFPLSYAPETQAQFDAVAFILQDMTEEQVAKWDALFEEIK